MRIGLLLACSGLLVWGQSEPCRVEGKVLNSVTGEPVRKARVALMSLDTRASGKPPRIGGASAITDAAGRFEFEGLAPGGYTLLASHEGFATVGGLGEPKLERFNLAAGEQKVDMVVRLIPFGLITGRILDEDGDPLRRVQVQSLVFQYTATGRRLAARDGATTNDLGEYRIFDLPPGRYYLKAGSTQMMGGGRPEDMLGTTYYPGTTDASAAGAIDVGAGQHVEGIDLTLHPTHLANVRGRVLNPGSNLMIGLTKESDSVTMSSATGVNDANGKFELTSVSPGSYLLTANGWTGGQHYSAHLPIQVGATDLEGIELRLAPPIDIAGQFRIEGKTSDKLAGLVLDLESEGHTVQSIPAATKDDGGFVVQGLEPDIYQISVQAPEDLYLKEAHWSDRDVTHSGLDLTQGAAESHLLVVMSANGGQIDGVATDDQSAPAAMAAVTLVPASAAQVKSSFKVARTGPAGHFQMQGVAPGSYKLYCWETVDVNQVKYDPEFLKPFEAQAESVEIAEGSKKKVQLKLLKAAAPPQPEK